MGETGFKIVTFKQLREMKVSTMKPRPKVVFVERRTALHPPEDKIRKYNEMMRRLKDSRGTHDDKRTRVTESTAYENLYRRKLLHSGKSLKTLRELAGTSRERLVVLVQNNDRPDSEIIVKICDFMKATETW